MTNEYMEAYCQECETWSAIALEQDPDNLWMQALHEAASVRDYNKTKMVTGLRQYPVDIETFLFDDRFIGIPRKDIYPEVLKHLKRINNPDGERVASKYTEVVLTGGIGTAKTTIALYTNAYQLYILSCFKHPQTTFGQDSMSEIIFVFQSVTGKVAKDLDYGRFRALLSKSHYFTKEWPFQKDIESELRFPDRIYVRPVSGDAEGTIGQNVFGGFIDEVNFMDVTQDSKRSHDQGEYNQALVIYNSIARRRESRFMQQGNVPGILCLGSSKNYPGEFTDQKIEEAKKNPAIYIYEKRVWDIKPWEFSGVTFDLFIGDATRQPRVLEKEDMKFFPPEDRHLIMKIPIEYKLKFEIDIMNSLREIAGVSTRATHPFMQRTDLVAAAFGKHQNIFSRPEVDFQHTMLKIYPKRIVANKEPRFAHIDLGVVSDSAGLVIGHVKKFMDIDRGGGLIERLPVIHIDGVLRVRPPKGGEINFDKIRNILYTLRNLGMPIRWVTLDSFQSVDTIQLLKQKGFASGRQSMDLTMLPYDFTKGALYDGRLALPEHETLQTELVSLEKIAKKNIVDHPPNGSKDVADALAGVVYGLTMRREIWARFGVTVNEALLDQIKKSEKRIQEGYQE